jgi:formamidopyrimidine-DNA glycosylase
MPELPDLEVYTKNLEKLVSRKEVIEVLVYKPGKVNVGKKEINDALVSSKVARFERDGKGILIKFDNGRRISVHLMIEGKFDIVDDIESVDFKVVAIKLDDGYLIVSDPRGWAKVDLDPQEAGVPDALSPAFSLDYFRKKLAEKKSKNIKAFLIDQNIVRGIGNAYVDEILWEAKISPESKAGKLPEDIAQRLYESIGMVLRRSVDEILHIAPNTINGEVRDFMRIHHKGKDVCPKGFPIHTKKIASKTTYYTKEQVVY